MIKICRSCSSEDLESVVDLGDQHLSDFRSDKNLPPKFPLHLMLCKKCNLAQLDKTVDRSLMYHDGYGYMSGVNEIIVKNLKMLVDYAQSFVLEPVSWLDIACNDGTLLSLVPQSVYKVGVDPVSKFKILSSRYASLIIDDFFPSVETENLGEFDIITSISMFYDIDDPNSFVKNVKNKLSKNGVWIIQQNYLLSMLENNSFDNICHEHIEYYSLKAMMYLMQENDLEVIDVRLDDINGGSLITAIAHKGVRKIQSSVAMQIEKELDFGLSTPIPFRNFEARIKLIKQDLQTLLANLKKQNKRVQIYGASTRGATIWQFIGVNNELVESAVERQEGKVGKIFSAIQIPIISESEMRINPPDYLLVGPWFLKDSFIEREKKFTEESGKFIFPLPEVEIYP